MQSLKKELDEYIEALEEHLKAQQQEVKIKMKVRATYSRLMLAKQEMKAKEKELLEDTITKANE